MLSDMIRYEPEVGYFIVIRIGFNNSVPSKFHNIIFDNGSSDHFRAFLIRNSGKWYIYINKLKFLPRSDIEQLLYYKNSEFKKNNIDVKIEINDKSIRRTVFSETIDFLNSIVKLDDVILYGVALLGLEDTGEHE